MKTERKIFIAFLLNLAFSLFEFCGGIFTGSVAIMSDAVHDIGDALSIGAAFVFEKISKKRPDERHTYGYLRYSAAGGVITTTILLAGSCIVIYNAILRMINPVELNYNGMMFFAVVGVTVNFVAAIVTHGGKSLNQRAVSLHMLEDVLGWVAVLLGALIMRYTGFVIIDPIISAAVGIFISVNAYKNLSRAVDLFLEKTPDGIDVDSIKESLGEIEGVADVHHIHIWSIDGCRNSATMHIVADGDLSRVKHNVRQNLADRGICHVTLEMEGIDEVCHHKSCIMPTSEMEPGCDHHHHKH